jgi:hypothetical protein
MQRRGEHISAAMNQGSKMWLRVPTDSEPRKTLLAKDSSIYKRQTHPLIREGALVVKKKKDDICQTVINIWS